MRIVCALFTILAFSIMQGCNSFSREQEALKAKGIFVDFNEVGKVKKLIGEGDKRFLPAYQALIERAGKAMNEGPFSVMDKKRIPASGDKHDYISMGPYWWPDPSKPDGLPYIRKDGNVNPETRGEYVDTDKKNKLFANVETLAWAFYFSGENKYAEKAAELIRTWFVNPETKMNPNLNYSQGIPGICDGRGIGIIDFSRIDKIITSLQILEGYDKLDAESVKQLNTWFDEYLTWLHSSVNGIDEEDEKNNHGTWYDVESAGIAMFLGKTETARARLEDATKKRIASQIEPDGSQPLEIARTRSLSYSAMNLRGFLNLAILGQSAGVDLWNYSTSDGRSIRKALDYLLPYVQGKEKWETSQITSMDEALGGLRTNYRIAASRTGVTKYVLPENENATDLEILLYP